MEVRFAPARAALALHPKALRQIEGSWDFLKRTPEA